MPVRNVSAIKGRPYLDGIKFVIIRDRSTQIVALQSGQPYVSPFDNLGANLFQFVLPALAVGYRSSALIMRITRSTMLEVLREDYIRTAWAKGQRERFVVWRHAFKNASLPVITVIGIEFAFLIGGLIVTETVFNDPRLLLLELRGRCGVVAGDDEALLARELVDGLEGVEHLGVAVQRELGAWATLLRKTLRPRVESHDERQDPSDPSRATSAEARQQMNALLDEYTDAQVAAILTPTAEEENPLDFARRPAEEWQGSPPGHRKSFVWPARCVVLASRGTQNLNRTRIL